MMEQPYKTIALAGNPNVGKSTVFNYLTGLNQHTGNWPGKTVSSARSSCKYNNKTYTLVDIPGTYSLMAHSAEEEVARDFICFGGADAVVVVCDATCLERNLNLVLQIIEITSNTIVCVNLMDEAKKKNIVIDLVQLSQNLGVPVVGTSARGGKGLALLLEEIELITTINENTPITTRYVKPIEDAIEIVHSVALPLLQDKLAARWVSLKLIDRDDALAIALKDFLGFDILEDEKIASALVDAWQILENNSITKENIKDKIVSAIVLTAEGVCLDCVCANASCHARDRKIDRVLTSKWTGIPIMIALLAVVFWITIVGSNYPSQFLSHYLFLVEDKLLGFLVWIGLPQIICEALAFGMYRVVAWVVAVMLPPMAIFFPLFTLLEDSGYLPRIAFNLDKYFSKASACGKQALTMCMGFGCNAVGVVGCRIIDSPRERLIAMITNNFVPCNGRFPILIAIITMFFAGGANGTLQTVYSSLLLTSLLVFGVFATFIVSGLLSKTILKGVPSSFTLELPPYRRPQFGKVIVRSVLDRTLFVLGRALVAAAPAGLLIWILANITVGDFTLLRYCSTFLDPFAHLIGLDGVILLAFILGLPANEIVMPIIIMAYISSGKLVEMNSLFQLKDLLVANGWTWITAVCTMLFSLMHWPCSTTCLTIKKETASLKWTAVSFLVPTVTGVIVCFVFANVSRLFA